MSDKSSNKFHGRTLMSREVNGFALREIIHQPSGKIPKHSHELAHIGFVLRGNFIEECEGKKLECKPLSASFLAPGATHSDDFRSEVHCYVLEIAPKRLNDLCEILTLKEPVFSYGGKLSWLALRLYQEARQKDEASSLAIEGLSLEILAELARKRADGNFQKPPRWLEQANEFIRERFTESLTHEQIAETVAVHPVYLAQLFRRYYGCTIGEYARKLRIEFACRRISATHDPLVEIALDAGFYDQSHFSKVFKHFTGFTPSRFRAILRTF